VLILVFSGFSFAQESQYFKEAFDKALKEKPRNCTGLCETKFKEEAKKKATEEAAKKEAEEKAAKKAAEEAAAKKAAEELAAQKAAAEAAAKKAVEDEAARKAAEEAAAWKAAEEEAAKKAAAEEAAKKAVADDAAKKAAAEEAAKKAAAEAAAKKAIEEEVAKKIAEETAKKAAAEEAAKKAEEATKKAEADAVKRAELKELEVEMVLVRGGMVTMGCTPEQGGDCNENESPNQNIELNDYFVSKHPVTQKLWVRVMGNNPSAFSGPNLPVESVSWNEIQVFIRELNKLTGKKYRLLTEAEWEYAARGGASAGSRRKKYSGDDNLDKVAWFSGNSDQRTQNVCTRQANELGICDMSGNVWEWVRDWQGNYVAGFRKDQGGPSKGTQRIYRGGSFQDGTVHCRVSRRNSNRPEFRAPNLGFRLASDK
jgi:formylglycine-generating enzyme required for sulfatase activity